MRSLFKKHLLSLSLLMAATMGLQAQAPQIGGNVFGGGRMADVDGGTTVQVSAGTITGSVYGANDISGNVDEPTHVTITGGTMTNVFGGANGYYGCNSATTYKYTSNFGLLGDTNVTTFNGGLTIPTVNVTNVTIDGNAAGTTPTINGSVYGGGNLAYIGKGSSTTYSFTYNGTAVAAQVGVANVTVIAGHILQNVFGGGNMASVFGTPNITINNGAKTLTIDGAVYGGNDKLGQVVSAGGGAARTASDGTSVASDVCYVKIQGTPTISAVYGGGNGDYDYTNTTIFPYSCLTQNYASNLPIQGKSFVDINTTGGFIGNAFAGGNMASVNNGATILLNSTGNGTGANNTHVGNVYGGNNKVDMPTVPEVKLVSGKADTVYGAGKMGGVSGSKTYDGKTVSTVINMNSANVTVGTIFGGSNVSGAVAQTAYISLTAGTVRNNVFGGANGDYGCNDGSVYTTNVKAPATTSTTIPSVKNTYVVVNGGSVGGSIYGGGNKAPIGTASQAGSTEVNLVSGTINNAFGGGNLATVYGVANIYTPSNSTITVTGGVYGGNDKSGNVTGTGRSGNALDGTPALSQANASSYVKIEGNPQIAKVYGGGNGDYTNAQYTAFGCNASKPTQTSSFVDIKMSASGNVGSSFGGGNAAEVGSATTYVRGVGHVSKAYAGGNSATATTAASIMVNGTASGHNDVDTVYGGNNLADMDILPTVNLIDGTIHTVYGGGNAGDMTCTNGSANGHTGLSTYVKLNNTNVNVTDIYGGCRAADVAATAYVDLLAGNATNVFGGNDVAGTVNNTVVNLDGNATVTNIYGGGNGKYDYANGNAYRFNSTHNAANLVYTGVTTDPDVVTDAVVNLTDGTVTSNVYGGGLAGDVYNTFVTVESGAEVQGTIFGGGCGNVEYIGLCTSVHPHVGNVGNKATVVVNGLGSPLRRIFGGGRAGDVVDVDLTVNESVNKKIEALYGGCLASNLTGTTTIKIGTAGTANSTLEFDTIYGGNDFSGLTQNTKLTINSGTVNHHVFGAGNGEYNYWTMLSGSCLDTVPYSMDVDVVINGGHFLDRVYGGGNFGLVGSKYISETNYPEGNHNSNLYGYIDVTVHDGEFEQHIFTGARGDRTGQHNKSHFGFQNSNNMRYAGTAAQRIPSSGITDENNHLKKVTVLAYAYKQFNMDGGTVHYSVYGGSEAVDDGYPYECWDSTGVRTTNTHPRTSMRPSSVVNIVGGTVGNRVYGGGFKGNAYGSIYVNIGSSAVDDSPVWTRNYFRTGSGSSASFGSFRPDLDQAPLYLRASIYNGSDWGEAGRNQYFNKRGFYGGEGYIWIDGEDYQTSLTAHSAAPEMFLSESIIGAGTSTSPADINSRIIIRNYGDFYCPSPSRQLNSVQRTNLLYLDKTYITFVGESDCYSSFETPNYSFNRIDTLIFYDKNVIENEHASQYIGRVESREYADISAAGVQYWALVNDYYKIATLNDLYQDANNCDNESLLCSQVYGDVTDGHNVLMLDNGTSFEMRPFTDRNDDHVDDDPLDYGDITGYLYLLAPEGTRAEVLARQKTATLNTNDGGFVAPCGSLNNANHELEYTNTTIETAQGQDKYRSWQVGREDGERKRHITLVAHADTNMVLEDHALYGSNARPGYAYVVNSLQLPTSNHGNYYTISSVFIDADNGGTISLVDSVWDPSTNNWYTSFGTNAQQSMARYVENPSYTFGLMFKLNQNFNPSGTINPMPSGYTHTQTKTVVSGNSQLVGMGGFLSAPIVETITVNEQSVQAHNVTPVIDFALTYHTDFRATLSRDVVFNMMEYEPDGTPVGPVEITVTISTVITEFDNLEAPVMAMYNQDTYDEYVRKVTIPASFQQRNLYLESITWKVDSVRTPSLFNLQATTTPINDYRHFSLVVNPTEDMTENITNTLGWYEIVSGENMDLFTTAHGSAATPDTGRYIFGTGSNGQLIGILDGRTSAAYNVSLFYDGGLMYEEIPALAHATLRFYWEENGNPSVNGGFNILIKVRTRCSGDTIYMAEPEHFYGYGNGTTSTECTGTPIVTLDRYDNNDLNKFFNDPEHCGYKKNDPKWYLNTFERAMDVYDEGDVICIMDPIHLTNSEKPTTLQGADYSMINIIRYSGSHYRWPSEFCTYRGPLMVVQNGAKFTLSNVRIDGKGCGLVAKGVTTSDAATLHEGGAENVNESYTIYNGKKYMYRTTQRDTLFADAPIFWVEDASRLYLRSNVTVTNNFSKLSWNHSYANELKLPGGAVGLRKTAAGTPEVVLGNMVYLKDNLETTTAACVGDADPGNFGAGVYVDGGDLELSTTSGKRTKDVIRVDSNYYIPQAARSTDFAQYFTSGTRTVPTPEGGSWSDPYYEIKKNPLNSNLHPNNVYLTRKKPASVPTGHDTLYVTTDAQSDLIHVAEELDAASRIGVSKWFPGYRDRDTYGRDTIGFVTYAGAGSVAAYNNFNSGVFLDDSVGRRDYNCDGTEEDNVDMLYSSRLSNTTGYLHRCGTFYEDAIPIVFEENPAVVCPGDGDILHYKVKGGAADYRYSWYTKNGTDYELTYENTSTSTDGTYVPLNLHLNADEAWKRYDLKVVAQEAGGEGCKVEHLIEVLVKQVGSSTDFNNSNTSGFGGGKVITENGQEKFISKYIDQWMGHSTETGWTAGTESTYHRYDAPGADYLSSDAENNVAKITRLYRYYSLAWDVQPAGSGTIAATADGTTLHSGTSMLCPGDVVHLNANPSANREFMMWDYDPSAPASTDFVVRRGKDTVVAYMAPNTYWYHTVTSLPSSGYSVEYHGNVHITNENGLAWLISTTNGLNYQQAETFIWDTIYIHDAAHGGKNSYDMSAHKWTPLGNERQAFRGTMIVDDNVQINNLIVNEDEVNYVGFFGITDSARLHKVKIRNSVFKGPAYGGGLIGYSSDSTVVEGADVRTTTVSAGNAVGGLLGMTENSTIYNTYIAAKLVGSTLYGGGLAGHATRTKTSLEAQPIITGTVSQDHNSNTIKAYASRLSALYLGGVFGFSQGVASEPDLNPAANGAKDGTVSIGHIQINNNYVNLTSSESSLYVGGLVGYASTTDLRNNYAYGEIKSLSANGGLMGRTGSYVNVDNCYFADGVSQQAFGMGEPQQANNITTFSGSGNHVMMNDTVGGVNNLTRALNNWVIRTGGDYATWRSDLEGENNGYPIFGTPDQIPVYDTVIEVVCDSYEVEGQTFTESGTYELVISDTLNYVDSTLTIYLTVNHSEQQLFADSVEWGSGYSGNGFYLTAEQLAQMMEGDSLAEVHVLQLVDSLLTEQGCDSIVVLNLTVYNGPLGVQDVQAQFNVHVYPNPSMGKVNVEADGLRMVEVYDVMSRQVLSVEATGSHCEFDLSSHATGSYYLRIHTQHGVAVQKVVKK